MIPQEDDPGRVLLFGELLTDHPLAQHAQLVAVQVPHKSARKLRRRASGRPDAVLLNRPEHILAV